jgi:CheY-like chemotaxis protein
MRKRTKVLLVEDNPLTRRTIKTILSKLSYELKETESGEEALERLAKTDYDVIILDIKLPGMSGIEMLKKAKAHLENLPPVVVLTDYNDYAFDAGKLGVFRFVPKLDLDTEIFKGIIVEAVNRKQELSWVKVKAAIYLTHHVFCETIRSWKTANTAARRRRAQTISRKHFKRQFFTLKTLTLALPLWLNCAGLTA